MNSYTKQIKKEFTFRSFIFADSHGKCFDRDAEKVRQDFKKKEEEINLLKISNAKKTAKPAANHSA